MHAHVLVREEGRERGEEERADREKERKRMKIKKHLWSQTTCIGILPE